MGNLIEGLKVVFQISSMTIDLSHILLRKIMGLFIISEDSGLIHKVRSMRMVCNFREYNGIYVIIGNIWH